MTEHKEVGSPEELYSDWDFLTTHAKSSLAMPYYAGELCQLPDGTLIGLRMLKQESGRPDAPQIDVFTPDTKEHFTIRVRES